MPKVTSSVVEFVPNPSPLSCDARLFSRLTQAAFGPRRKMLPQSLRNLDVEPVALLEATGIKQTRRAVARAGRSALEERSRAQGPD